MVLQGYDDVTPVSDAETAYVIIVQIVGALCSSSMLANFLFIFRFRNSRYSAFSTHVDNAREYMRSKGIPRVIRHQVIAYFNYAWNTHHGLDSEEALYLMPKHLQSKVIATLKATRIKQVSFLAKESVEFINSLALALDRRVYSPTDQIIEPKTNAQMYFVIRGSVVISAFDGSNPKDSQTGDFFAEICLLLPEQYEEKAIAKTFCELYVLSKVKFDEVVSHFYRGSEAAVVTQMAETLEKHSVQQRKTRKLLGHVSSVIALNRRNNHRRTVTRMKEDWNLPDSSFRLVWDTMHLMAVVYVAFEVPYHAVFVSMAEGENMFIQDPTIGLRYVCTLLAELFFVVDIVLRSRYLAYLDPIVMLNVVDPLLIFRKYREDGFFLDIIACIPVGIVVDSVSNLAPTGYSWLFRLPRLLRVRYLPGMVRDLGDAYSISSKLHMFISLLLGVALLLHVIGCIWFEMAWIPRDSQGRHGDEVVLRELTRYDCLRQASRFDNCSWVKFDCYTHVGVAFPAVDKASMYDNSFAYVRSVYWAVGTLTAVGYGDILAFSTAESYFAAVWIFVSGIINFGVVGAMSNTLSNIMAPRYQHLEHLNTLSSIMDRMSISEMLSAEIRRFYNQHFHSCMGSGFME
ncbi:hypothetical protein PHYBOEH_005425 [Phytophthora boehmeriae]|uniref:Cyclic nucleotide-binding domain-containing protein n=1 Tax=Phytophthora boehmeriae TaxID=109152 RepID=A0A8T1WR32_9STRA|nr:hypothetical protein PHYBOEH_005425 [Phytophthora boehmeriae]